MNYVGQRSLILIPYPFSDSNLHKVRPALIVSNNEFNRHGDDVVAIPLTSVIKQELFSVLITQSNLQEGKLIKESRARADKIFSVSKNRIIMKIGEVNKESFDKIKKEILKIL